MVDASTDKIDLSGPFQEAKVPLDTAYPIPVGGEVAGQRATKAYYGLGTATGLGKQQIQDLINRGREGEFRDQAASAVDIKNTDRYVRSVQSAATPGQLKYLTDAGVTKEDPNEVIEKNYSDWYNRFKSPLFQFREYVNTQAENADVSARNQPWLPWLAQQAETNLIPGYYDVSMRWAAKDFQNMWEGMLGSQLSQTARNIYSDPSTAREKFDQAYKNLEGNPGMQSAFAHAVLGQTNSEKLMNNVFSVMDASVVGGAMKGGVGIARNIYAWNSIRRTLKEAYLSGFKEGDPIVNKLASQGEISESAVEQAAKSLTGTTDATKETLSELPSNWSIHEQTLEVGGGGKYGNGLLNTIKADFNRYKNNVTNMLENAMRVNRTPIVEASKQVVEAIRASIRDRYRGPSASLMDVEGPVHDNASNNYFFTYIMGSENQEAFDSAQEAFNAAQKYGYPAEDTMRDRVNREVGPKIAELDFKLSQLVKQKKRPARMEDDTAGLNTWNSLQSKIDELTKQRDDLLSYQAEHLIGPEVNIPGATVRQLAPDRHVIAYKIPMSEIDDVVRNGLIFKSDYLKHLGTSLPHMDEHIKATLAYLRTPGETLSPSEVSQRIIATHGAGQFLKIAQANSYIISRVPRSQRKDFRRVLEANQEMMDPHDGLKGYFFEDIPQLEEYYQTHIGRPPSEQEVRAYFAHKTNWDYDRILRGLLSLRNKNSRGVESHSIEFKDSTSGLTQHSQYFDGITQGYAPGGHDLVAVLGDSLEDTKYGYADSTRMKQILSKMGKKIDQGNKQVVELHDVQARPLASFLGNNDAIRYVITDKVNRRKLEFGEQIGRRGGGHWDWDYEWAVKQPKMTFEKVGSRARWRYEGDTFLAWAENHAMGKEFLDHLNQVREYMDAKEYKLAENYHKSHFDFPWEDHKKHYFPHKVDGVMRPAMFSTEDPFYLVRKDKKVVDLGNDLRDRYNGTIPGSFYDATREGSVARTQQIQYTGERDARDVFAIDRKGDWRNPVFGLRKADFADPMHTMDRALSRIVNSTFMEDYKMMGVEHWLRNAKPWLTAEEGMLENAPWYVFNHFGEDISFAKDTPESVKNMLTNNWKKINDFVGMPSRVERWLDRVVDNLANELYNKRGMIIPSRYLPRLKNPFQLMRSAVFDMKFLFSPGTFFTQASTFFNVIGMAGLKYAPATVGALTMHQLARMNARPEMLAAFGRTLEHFGWRPGEWEEARLAGLTWGNFFKVGQEHAMLDSMVQNRTIDNAYHNIQYFGRKFFEEGAESTRVSAFYAAYKRFKDANPTKAIGRQEKEQIMAEAADFDHNMSRAFNSSLHTGGASWFGQFYAYAMRLGELMTGKRLTLQQKARMIGVTSLMWGVPLGGLGLFFFPLGDAIRQEMILNRGYVPGNNAFEDVFMKGMPSVLHSMITGEWYDYEKFGTKGVDPLIGLMEGDKTWFDVFGGATMETIKGAWKRTSPLISVASDMIDGNFKLTWHDLISPLQEYSAINDEERLRYALDTGKWISKNGTTLTDVDQPSAWFMTMTGITKTSIADIGLLTEAGQSQESYNQKFTNRYVQEMRMANDALNNNDQESWQLHINNAQVWMDKLPIGARTEAAAAANRSFQPLVDRVRWKLFMNPKYVPPGKEEQRGQTFQQLQR